MSLLSKIFIFLVLLAAAFSAFVTATLYFNRVDFHDKWLREAQAHAATAAAKDAEIGHLRNVANHQEAVIEQLHRKNTNLEGQIASLNQNLVEANQQLNQATQQLGRLTETLRVQMAQVEALLVMVDRQREQVEQLKNERDLARQESQNARAELINVTSQLEQMERDLARAEDQIVTLARDNNRLQQQIDQARQSGFDVDVAGGGQPLDGFVRGVDPETRLVVISVGQEAGVRNGMEFTVYRDSVYVAKVTIERVDRDWAAGRYSLEVYAPRVGDRVSNRLSSGQAASGGAGR